MLKAHIEKLKIIRVTLYIYIYMLLFRYSKFLDFLNITLKIKYFYLKVLVEIQNSNNLRPRYLK